MFKQLPGFIKLFLLVFIINSVFITAYSSFSKPNMDSLGNEEQGKGQKLFKSNCSGCHLNGQNLIKPDKPVIGSAKLASKEAFSVFISSPPQPMPNFKNIAEKPGQLNALYEYVSSLMGK